MSLTTDHGDARCRQDDVDPTWWLEGDREDLDQPLPESMSKMEKIRARRRDDADLREERQNQLRAKFYCYECPLLGACRQAGWQEGYHVWGGLDARERYTILKTGTTDEVIRAPQKGTYSMTNPLIQRFLAGDSIPVIVAETGVNESTLMNRLRGTLASIRVEREEREGWRSRNLLPALPHKMSQEAYRHGQAVWSLLERESA